MKRMNFIIACLRPSQNVKLGIFTGSLAVEVKNNIIGANSIAPADSIPNVFSTRR